MARDGSREQLPKTLMTPMSAKSVPRKKLQGDISPGCIHELRKESEEKESRLRIQDIEDNALPKDAAQFDARGFLGKIERLLAAQFLHAQIDQICRAKILYG